MPRQPSEQDWPLRTARLSIRRATEADLEATWQFRRLPEVCEWLTLDASDKEEYTARYLSESRLSKTLIVELDEQVIGDLMLAVDDAWAQVEVAEQARNTQAELGWVIAPEHAGKRLRDRVRSRTAAVLLRGPRRTPRRAHSASPKTSRRGS